MWRLLIYTCALVVTGLLPTYSHAVEYNADAAEVTITGTELWGCHVPERSAKVLKEERGSLHGRQIIAYRMSRDYQTFDMMLIYAVANGKASTFPVYYVYDKDRDGRPDIAYADEHGNGICQQMREIPVHSLVEQNENPETDVSKPEPPAMEHDEESCHQGAKPSHPDQEA